MALSNNFGFGGHNACLVIKKFQELSLRWLTSAGPHSTCTARSSTGWAGFAASSRGSGRRRTPTGCSTATTSSSHRSRRAAAIPYRDVLAETLARLASEEGLTVPPGEEGALGDSLPSWKPFPEVPGALADLRSRGFKLVPLSNTDPEFLAASLERIGVPVDGQVTAADAGSYKPAPGHWERFFERYGAERESHVHVAASLFHDIAPADQLGLRAVWINRLGETSDLPRAAELKDLSRLPDVLDELVPQATL